MKLGVIRMTSLAPQAEDSEIDVETFAIKLLMPRGERILQVSGNQYIWEGARQAGIDLPAMCHQGRCLTCAGSVVGPPGARGVDQSASDRYLPDDQQAGFVLLCTGRPLADLQIQTHQQDAMRANRLSHGLPAPYS